MNYTVGTSLCQVFYKHCICEYYVYYCSNFSAVCYFHHYMISLCAYIMLYFVGGDPSPFYLLFDYFLTTTNDMTVNILEHNFLVHKGTHLYWTC
jgi:hypothetical protein